MWKAFGHWPYNQRQVSYRDFEGEPEPVSTLQELQSGAADPYSGLWRRKSWSRRRRKEGKNSLEAISLLHTKCSALQLLSVKYSKGKKNPHQRWFWISIRIKVACFFLLRDHCARQLSCQSQWLQLRQFILCGVAAVVAVVGCSVTTSADPSEWNLTPLFPIQSKQTVACQRKLPCFGSG